MVCASAKEVAERSEVIVVMVPDTPDVERVLFAAGGVAEGLAKGKLVIDMSKASVRRTDAEWRALLTPQQYRVARQQEQGQRERRQREPTRPPR